MSRNSNNGIVTKMDINNLLYDIQGSDTIVEWEGEEYTSEANSTKIGTLTVNNTAYEVKAPVADEILSRSGFPPILNINGNTPDQNGSLTFNAMRFFFGKYSGNPTWKNLLNTLDSQPQDWDVAIFYKYETTSEA